MRFLSMVVACLALAGCGSGKTYKHTATEEAALEQMRNETPEQKIERIQKGPMPASQKDAMIKEIKEKNGIK